MAGKHEQYSPLSRAKLLYEGLTSDEDLHSPCCRGHCCPLLPPEGKAMPTAHPSASWHRAAALLALERGKQQGLCKGTHVPQKKHFRNMPNREKKPIPVLLQKTHSNLSLNFGVRAVIYTHPRFLNKTSKLLIGDDCQKLLSLSQTCFPGTDSISQVAISESKRMRQSK